MKLKNLFISVDFIVALISSLLLYCFGPRDIPHRVAGDFYGVAISVLAIVFSVFFAALAAIISTSDDAFVRFLEQEGLYGRLISAFKVTLFLLFAALMYALVAYVLTAVFGSEHSGQRSYYMCGLLFLFLWSLVATFNSARDAIKYAQRRAVFLQVRKS